MLRCMQSIEMFPDHMAQNRLTNIMHSKADKVIQTQLSRRTILLLKVVNYRNYTAEFYYLNKEKSMFMLSTLNIREGFVMFVLLETLWLS